MEKEQRVRSRARLINRIQNAGKFKRPTKPLAPVQDIEYTIEPGIKCRAWKWIGDRIESQGLVPGFIYTTVELRAKGYKLPKISK